MIEENSDEERRLFVAPPLTDDESSEEPDAPVHPLRVEGETYSSGTTFRMPVWLRESSASFHWSWVPLPLRKAARATARWVKGPDPPHDLRFRPFFPKIQELPVQLFDHYAHTKPRKIAALLFIYFIWFLTWFLILVKSNTSGNIEGYGRPQPISCASSYWSSGNSCGLNGNGCRPFKASPSAFRCPANCKSLILLDERTVGNQTLNYQPLIIGGPESNSSEPGIYRADSFVCQAAIHAGVVTDAGGGCGVVKLEGAAHSFPASTQNGFTSTEFTSTFPKSFSFVPLSSAQATCPSDPRWLLLGITTAAVALISIFTTSPGVFFFSTFGLLIIHVGVVSDPPNMGSLTDLFSLLLSRVLPASFIAYVLYLYAARILLRNFSSPGYQLEKTILYLTPAFIGALNNYTFALWIPLQRLTPHDLQNQPGAKLALGIVVTIILTIVLTQTWFIRQAGLMPRYLKVYISFVAGILFLLALPGLRLRIHHYILAMLLIPGTAIPTRPSVIYQGLLLGLFINGVARWGFASIIETPAALGEDPTTPGGWWGASYPNITNSSVAISLEPAPSLRLWDESRYYGNGNITFDLWEYERMGRLGVDGISILVNDVERWRGYLDENRKGKFTWHRHGSEGLELINTGLDMDVDQPQEARHINDEDYGEPQDLFFRFAFMRGSSTGHYGGSGVWLKDGRWIGPPPQKKPDPYV
ncbi:uncharacterized protein TRUGW13939_08442 [Talaromyces rugulosus]|uniref:LCCL domain-containing protein n=1 Tax=Talaromyces rugulosus TaxID=121627 RepID=A0A7H8R4I8_TALRU|nr:uncharacterized protein TRUGW13939_08442 [Talaromyces rugulosus]QKX61294.1 hypothetical protein TRUGW13939_08442 [Talaromyces rugulosus]